MNGERAEPPGDVAIPVTVFGGLQHERTALAWERTAIAMMVAGVAFTRFAGSGHVVLGLIGVTQTVAGGALLFWAGRNDYELHSPATPASAVPKLRLAQVVGLGTLLFTGLSLATAMYLAMAT